MTPLLFPVQPNKEVSVEKSFKIDEEDGAKPKLTETKKVNHFSTSFIVLQAITTKIINSDIVN